MANTRTLKYVLDTSLLKTVDFRTFSDRPNPRGLRRPVAVLRGTDPARPKSAILARGWLIQRFRAMGEQWGCLFSVPRKRCISHPRAKMADSGLARSISLTTAAGLRKPRGLGRSENARKSTVCDGEVSSTHFNVRVLATSL